MGRGLRILAVVLAVAIVGSGVFLTASRLSPHEPVTIATYRQAGSLPVWVAYELGFFAEEGVDVRLVEFSGGGLSAYVLETGGADITGFPTVLGLRLAASGTMLKLVHPTYDALPGTSQLLVRADLDVRTLEGLRGRTVAFEALEPSCLPCTAFHDVLVREGVDVVRIAVPDYKIEEAFENRIADAAVVSQPFTSFAVAKGLAYPLLDARLGPAGDAAAMTYGTSAGSGDSVWKGAAGFWTTEAFLKSRPGAFRRVALAVAAAATWLHDPAHEPLARQIFTKYAGGLGAPEFFEAATAAVLASTEYPSYPTGYTDWPALRRQAEAYEALGILDVSVDVRALVTTPWFRA